jgi:hypothetical protein
VISLKVGSGDHLSGHLDGLTEALDRAQMRPHSAIGGKCPIDITNGSGPCGQPVA